MLLTNHQKNISMRVIKKKSFREVVREAEESEAAEAGVNINKIEKVTLVDSGSNTLKNEYELKHHDN